MSVRYSGLSPHLVDDDARLEPYVLLPSQTRRERARSPEENLWWAVLEISWRDLHGKGHPTDGRCYGKIRKSRLAAEAAEWFADPSEAVLSYRWVCLMLGYEPNRSGMPATRTETPLPALEPPKAVSEPQRALNRL